MKTWIPRLLQDDGMIPMCEAPSYAKLVTQYVKLADHEQALAEKDREIERLQAQLATAKGEIEHWTHDSFKRREAALREALQGILDIGKRDMSNPKYDGYFATAREALKEHP